ncbi:hypothetical protein [Streptomyces sp. NPDC051572]
MLEQAVERMPAAHRELWERMGGHRPLGDEHLANGPDALPRP